MNTENVTTLPEIISANEAQKSFKLSRTMVYSLLNNPDCGIVKIGRRKFFHRDKFLAWLEAQTKQT